jgi:hypothetical protein
MFRYILLFIETAKARGSYLNRVWFVLFLPVLVGTFRGWTFKQKLDALCISLVVVVLYSAAQLIYRNYLKPR